MAAGVELMAVATDEDGPDYRATRALYDAANDRTQNVPAAYGQLGADGRLSPLGDISGNAMPLEPTLAPPPAPGARPPVGQPSHGSADARQLFEQGEAALRAHDPQRAYQLFRQAAERIQELDPLTAQRLQNKLQMLSAPRTAQPAKPGPSPMDEAAAQQHTLSRRISADVAMQVSKARAQQEKDPKAAVALLEQARRNVEGSGLEPATRQRLLARVDLALNDMRRYLEQNQPRIELEEKNRQTEDQIEREQQLKLEIQGELALMVDDFNKKMDEQRWLEAEVVAKRAAELDPTNPVVLQLLNQAKFVRRFVRNQELQDAKERGYWEQLDAVADSSVPFDDRQPYRFGDVKEWERLSDSRRRLMAERDRNRTPAEMEIEKKLRTPVSLTFQNEPLARVLETLARMTNVNLHLDEHGLAQEGVSTDTPVSISVQREIMLKSALNLILEPLHLSYVIKDEVLKITSEQLREGEVYTVMYNVADLVVPIPNFVPTPRMGLAGSYHDAMANVGFGGAGSFGTGTTPLAVVASKDGNPSSATLNPALLAQMSAPGQAQSGSMPMGFGPGGLGGAAQADFDSLIQLITSTIQPPTWIDVGGAGSIAPFETNLSIVVSQTQEVHEEIVDLLEQLRRLQDLQVTIEVRFITLNDNFFERIGVDFDFDIDDDIDRPFQVFGRTIDAGDGDTDGGDGDDDGGLLEPERDTRDVDYDRSVTVGLQAPGVFSADLDIPFTQNSFGLAVPQFGGFDASAGAQLGFAILSDIEAFFFINAAQGDRRSNVLQAPKVTLFNGQQAFVSDTSQSPFVISVVPVVGDFAAAQQPVIVVLSEGTHMTVQAVVSNDRRFVRLTVVPFFSKIGKVNTFQFTGSETTTQDTTAEGWVNPDDPNDNRRNNATNNTTQTRQGTTVQLPTFSFVTVTTTVSVPDGGTVLLGGIKRLSEGRNEFGTPILNKIPYINRLFKNVGIGRETQSLMMMVTPRIIIQEEEEEKLGILPPP